MIRFFITAIQGWLEPYEVYPVIFDLHLWKYVVMALLFFMTFVVTWIFLRLLRRFLSLSEGRLTAFERFKRRVYYLTLIGMMLYAKPFLDLPVTVFWQTTMTVFNVIFAVISLMVVNRLIDVVFVFVNQKMRKAHWEETGILQLLKGLAKIGSISVTFLLVSGLFVDYGIGSLLKNISIGAGTVTAILALASKDLISNFFGALVVTVGKPFKIGDWIIVNKLEGRVISIGIRDTKLQTTGGVLIYIPNSTFINKHIHNYGKTVYMPVSLDLMLVKASEKALEGFLSGLDELFEQYPALKTHQCRLEVRDVDLKKGYFTLHLYFEKIKEEEKVRHMRVVMEKVAALAKKSGIALEG